MKKPILFKGEMVRAILEGRKTQTRRVIKDAPNCSVASADPYRSDHSDLAPRALFYKNQFGDRAGSVKIQYALGDLLWVRENWSGEFAFQNTKPSERESFSGEGVPYLRESIWYWADGSPEFGDWEKQRPSIFMPKWASRITLEVTEVRVQRLQDISEKDAEAEGADVLISSTDGLPWCRGNFNEMTSPREWFKRLWDSINSKRDEGKYSWKSNPWVVAYTFKPIFKNVDQVLLELANPPKENKHG